MLKHVSYRSSSASLNRPYDYPLRPANSVGNRSTSSCTGHDSEPCKANYDSPNISYIYPPPSGGDSSTHLDDNYSVRSSFSYLTNSDNGYRTNPDNVSLTSTLSLSSLSYGGKYSSRCNSTISLHDQATVPVKIYLRRLRPDMEYKTVSLSLQTTCKQLVRMLMTKFRLRHRDPNLFFVLMEVTVRSPLDGAPVKRQLVLEDNSRPAELQQCRPKGEANFSIGVRRGGLLRVHDSILMPGSQYKSLMVSYSTTSDDVVQLLLNCYNSKEDPNHYCLQEVCKITCTSRTLRGDESPIHVQSTWPKDFKDSFLLVLRRNISYTLNMKSKFAWRRSLDQSSTDTEPEIDDHNTTRASIMSSTSTLSSSSTLSGNSTSSGVSSDDSSACSSSSGVCSVTSDSLLSSPQTSTPVKQSIPPSSSSLLETSTHSVSPTAESTPRTGKPPRPVPRTLFPETSPKKSVSSTTLTNEEEDSGIVMEDEIALLKLDDEDIDDRDDSNPLEPPPRTGIVMEDGIALLKLDDDGIDDSKPPKLPPRTSSLSSRPPLPPNLKYTSVKSLSKSSVNLSHISPISKSKSKSKSFLNLSLSNILNNDTRRYTVSSSNGSLNNISKPEVKGTTFLSTSTPKFSIIKNLSERRFSLNDYTTPERRYSLNDSTTESPIKIRLATQNSLKNSPCSCKTCFYI